MTRKIAIAITVAVLSPFALIAILRALVWFAGGEWDPMGGIFSTALIWPLVMAATIAALEAPE